MNKFEVIYEDDVVLVCYKPAGIATQTKRLGQQDMESLLKNYRAKKKETPYIGIVHRLDQPVEGVMVFAKTQKAAAELSKQVQQRSIGKRYYAISRVSDAQKMRMQDEQMHKQKVQNHQIQDNQEWVSPEEADTDGYLALTDYLIFDARKNLGQVVPQEEGLNQQETKQSAKENVGRKSRQTSDNISGKKTRRYGNAKKAVLEYKICGVHEDKVMLDILLHTGRHHQIRLQMANAGYPLVGDQKYGESQRKEQLALCSYFIEFVHPDTKKKMTFSIKPKNELFEEFNDYCSYISEIDKKICQACL